MTDVSEEEVAAMFNALINRVMGTLLLVALVMGVTAADAANPISSCTTLGAPGTYVLTTNLHAIGNCLTVQSDSVSIDFQGFVITGDGSGAGIEASALVSGLKAITIRDGTIDQFATGIDLGNSTGITVQRMILTNNGAGVFLGDKSLVANSIFTKNALPIFVGAFARVTANTLVNNNGGVRAIGSQAVVTNNVLANSGGIFVPNDGTIKDNVVVNAVDDFGSAIEAGSRALITGNVVVHAVTLLGGVVASDNSTVTGNIAMDNDRFGISTASNSLLTHNTANLNHLGGLAVGCPSTVRYNTAVGNSVVDLEEVSSGCVNTNNNAPNHIP